MTKNPLYFLKGVLGRTFYTIPQRPERIQIEITNRCNFSCGMCPRDLFNLSKEDIPSDLFKKVIDRITLNNPFCITLTGWGEPLLHPALPEMIAYVKSKGHNVGITTNGLLLNLFTEEFIKTPLDKLTISLDSVDESNTTNDGHPANKIVQKNIETLIQHRGNRKKPIITIQITMHSKHQCLDVVRFAGETGADRVYLVRLNVPLGQNSLKRPGLKEEREIYQEAEKIAGKSGLQVDNNYAAFDNEILRMLYKQLRPVMYRFDKYCPKPYDYLYINIDGKATPCCDLPRYEVGNILKQSLDEIWHGENLRYFREHQGEVCGSCDALRLKHLN